MTDPRPRLRGGGDPDALDEALDDDPRQLAARVPRGWIWTPRRPHGESVDPDGTWREDLPDQD